MREVGNSQTPTRHVPCYPAVVTERGTSCTRSLRESISLRLESSLSHPSRQPTFAPFIQQGCPLWVNDFTTYVDLLQSALDSKCSYRDSLSLMTHDPERALRLLFLLLSPDVLVVIAVKPEHTTHAHDASTNPRQAIAGTPIANALDEQSNVLWSLGVSWTINLCDPPPLFCGQNQGWRHPHHQRRSLFWG